MSYKITRWEMRSGDEPLVETEVSVDEPGEGRVLVEVAGCGVCHTDLGFYYDGVRTRHPLPLTLGHEISGRVIAAGAGAEQWQDAAVIIPAVMPCGECDVCKRGLGNICASQLMPGNDMHGGFASHIVVPAHGLCRVDEQRLATTGLALADLSVIADAVTTPYQSAAQLDIQPGDLAIVVGVGGVGGYAVQIASAMGAKVVAIDVVQDKLDALKGYGADLFECSGTGPGQLTAYGLLTFGAKLAVVGFTMDKVEVRLSNLMAFHATAVGNWGCLPEYYPPALDLVLDGKVSMKPFIRQYPLSEINAVFTAAHAHEITERPVLVP